MINKIKRLICKPKLLIVENIVEKINEENAKSLFYEILMDRNSEDKKLDNEKIIKEILDKWYCDISWLKNIREELADYIIDFERYVGYFEIDKDDFDEIILNLDQLNVSQIKSLLFQDESLSNLKKHIDDKKDINFAIILCERLIKRFQEDDLKNYQDKIRCVYENICFDKLNKDWRLKILFLKFVKEKNFYNLPNNILNSFFQGHTSEIIKKALKKHREYFQDTFNNTKDKDFETYCSNINKYLLDDIKNIFDYINNKDFLELLIRIDEKTYKENKESIKEHIKEITFNNVEDIEYYIENIVKLKEVLKIEDDEFDKLNKENIKKIKRFLEENKDTYPNCFIDLLKNYKEKGKYFREVLIKYFDISKENDIFIYEFLPKCIADLRESNIVEWDDFSEATKFLKLSDSEKEILKNNNIKITKEVEKFDNEKLMNFIEEDKEVGQSNDVENIIQELKDDITRIEDEILDLFRKKLKSLKANLRQS